MIFQITKYRISKESDDELVISRNKNYVKFEIAIAILGCLLFSFFLWNLVDFSKIGLVEVSFLIIILTTFYSLLKCLKTLRDGETIVFNSSSNHITKNGRAIGRINSIYRIDIIKIHDYDSPTEYELEIHMKDYEIIRFQKTMNLQFQKTLGIAISRIANIPFDYLIREEQKEQEMLEQKEMKLQPYIRLFEKKFSGKTIIELQEISKENSGYAEYAQKAAKNLLNRMKDSNSQKSHNI